MTRLLHAGTANCPAQSLDETYGFDWCPGDEELLKFVGREGYAIRPATSRMRHPTATIPGPSERARECLPPGFGTRRGTGLPQVPQPALRRGSVAQAQWRLGSWDGYNRRLSDDAKRADANVSHLADASIEPPFRIGTACGSCHIAFNPLTAGRSRTSAVGKHSRPGRQPVPAHIRTAGFRHAQDQSGMAGVAHARPAPRTPARSPPTKSTTPAPSMR